MLFDNQPDVLIETGTQNGGGAIFYASIMRMYSNTPRVVNCDLAAVDKVKLDYAIPGFCERVGCRKATDSFVWKQHVTFVQGKSTSAKVLQEVERAAAGAKAVMVVLDSLHTYGNVLEELKLYWKFVSVGHYLLVQDTKLDRIRGRPHARAAVQAFLQSEDGQHFELDTEREYLLYSQHHGGWLRRVR